MNSDTCNLYSAGCVYCAGTCQHDDSCEEESKGKDKGPLLIIAIVVPAAVIFIIIIVLVAIAFRRKSYSQNHEPSSVSLVSLSEFSSMELMKTKDFSSDNTKASLTLTTLVDFSQLGIELDKEAVVFNEAENGGLLNVNSKYTSVLSIKNVSKNTLELAFAVENTDRNLLTIIPDQFKLAHNKSQLVQISLTMRGSGKYLGVLKLGVTETTEYVEIPVNAEAVSSCFLSIAEIKVGKKIGAGAYGSVYIGEYRGNPVAIKEIKVSEVGYGEDDAFEEIDKEVLLMSKLKSSYIVEFYGIAYTEQMAYTVMELCSLGSVSSYLKKNKASEKLKFAFCLDAARGLLYLHQMKIIHRDIKPDNLLLVSVSMKAPVRAKISDFGTSKIVSNEDQQALTKAIGTPVFMAPEVLDGQNYSLPADIYSLGMTFWSILTGQVPYCDCKDNMEVYKKILANELPELPSNCKLNNIISKACAMNASERPKASKLVSELAEILDVEIEESLSEESSNYETDSSSGSV